MKIISTKIGAALVVSVGVVAVSAATLVSSLGESSALTIGSMASAARLVGDSTLASDLKRMPDSERSSALSLHGLSSEAALAARIADTRGQMNDFMDRQPHVRTMANYASGFLYASLVILAIISIKAATILGRRKPSSDAVHA
ncbi:hypothetical protein ACT2FY_00375 [Paraburkholderia fungorum]|uniref:hypothetical protein n=1 Tax=Paraburkholderia fungorum TaxID=134537 RepID=UPI00402B406C